jgi:hypothetical protein
MDDFLRRRARRLIEQGQLPKDPASRVFAGQGPESRCRLCGQSILADLLDVEVLFVSQTDEPTVADLHVECYVIWLAEVRLEAPRMETAER